MCIRDRAAPVRSLPGIDAPGRHRPRPRHRRRARARPRRRHHAGGRHARRHLPHHHPRPPDRSGQHPQGAAQAGVRRRHAGPGGRPSRRRRNRSPRPRRSAPAQAPARHSCDPPPLQSLSKQRIRPPPSARRHALPTPRAPVAQLDRAPDYESGGQRFESFRARHSGTKPRTRFVPAPNPETDAARASLLPTMRIFSGPTITLSMSVRR